MAIPQSNGYAAAENGAGELFLPSWFSMPNPLLATPLTGEEFQVLLVLGDRYNGAFSIYFCFWDNYSRLSN